MKNQKYNKLFYKGISERAIDSANIIVPMVLNILPHVDSVVDFGCGMGAWLSVFRKNGCKEIRGLDGSWIDKDSLYINKSEFMESNFDRIITLDKKYDLAISLEVAEHLPEYGAESFIDSLTRAADFILFSAAIPFQGGTNHINEQWPEYWNRLFNKFNFVAFDYFRKRIWNETKVSVVYRQNIILFVKREYTSKIFAPPPPVNYDFYTKEPPLSLVHYETYLQVINNDINRITFKKILKIIIVRILKRLFGNEIIYKLKAVLKRPNR